jgi:hypothetical protein
VARHFHAFAGVTLDRMYFLSNNLWVDEHETRILGKLPAGCRGTAATRPRRDRSRRDALLCYVARRLSRASTLRCEKDSVSVS